MTDVAITVENVSKVFRIYDRPGDRLKEAFSFRRKEFHTDFTALREISFDVRRGEFLGIVGRNGAGKSTLLRIVSRELTPTTGNVVINGKVSLLQLGVGFDPELTGLDNARFASKLLGYSDDEIEGMLADIVAFADIGEFIHHPVKTYSSGMHSRLSFAVGINIDPDILIADEVLSVGDMRFSQKCLRKMREFKEQGKTIIFVSHDIQSVNAFCDSAIWLKDGGIFLRGGAKDVTTSFQNYMLYNKLPAEYDLPSQAEASTLADDSAMFSPEVEIGSGAEWPSAEWVDVSGLASIGDGRAKFTRMAFTVADERVCTTRAEGSQDMVLMLEVAILSDLENPQIGFVVYDKHGLPALHTNNDICGFPVRSLKSGGAVVASFRFRLPPMANGNYMFSIGIQTGMDMAHKVDGAYEFSVLRSGIKATQCGYMIIEDERFDLQIVEGR